MTTADEETRTILALERAALDRWGRGEPAGYLDISGEGVSYFDPVHPRRIDGKEALATYYLPITGQIRIIADEIIQPRVQIEGDAAIVSFQYVSQGSEGRRKWNCTEVYARRAEGWRIIHTHWSFAAEE